MRIDPKLIIKTLKKNNGAVRTTAQELGVSPATVINWRLRASDTVEVMRNTDPRTKLKNLESEA